MESQTLSDRLLAAVKNNPYIAVLLVAATIIGAVATFTNTVSSAYQNILEALGLDGRAHAIYRPLVANLDNLERAVHALAALNSATTIPPKTVVLAEVHMVEAAAEPVCKARDKVSELGDASTRKELDGICTTVEMMRPLAENTTTGEGATSLAAAFEELGTLKQVRQKLVPRT